MSENMGNWIFYGILSLPILFLLLVMGYGYIRNWPVPDDKPAPFNFNQCEDCCFYASFFRDELPCPIPEHHSMYPRSSRYQEFFTTFGKTTCKIKLNLFKFREKADYLEKFDKGHYLEEYKRKRKGAISYVI